MHVQRRRFAALVIGVTATVASALVLTVAPASGTSSPSGSLVSAVPATGTPDIKDGEVDSIAQVGDTMILGGTFTQAANDGSTTILPRAHLVAFDQNTGQISTTFHPDPNAKVDAVIPAGDGSSVYVAGTFSSINGVARKNLARVRVSDGAVLTTFNAGAINGEVMDLRLSGGHLWVAGSFTTIKGTTQKALATVNPTTGALDPYMSQVIAGTHHGGATFVRKMDISPDGKKLVAVGNFDTIAGTKHHQAFMLDLSSSAAATVANWQTAFYQDACSSSFNTYMRDLDFSPDGSYFVVSTTGAYGGSNSACDETARWETSSTGAGLTPSWVDYTGGDTTYAVEITDSAVYTGGHARWQNNPFAGDSAGPGSVARTGIAALDPQSGLPFSWNPTRARGVGVFDFLVNSRGLWVASDTTTIGNRTGRERIALMPTGGTSIAAYKTPTIPNYVYRGSAVGSSPTTGLTQRFVDTNSFGAASSAPDGGIDWSKSRGAFMLNGQVYIAMSDGTLTRRSFDGSTYGSPVAVNTQDLINPLTDWRNDIINATGMFYDSKRIYFTETGQSTLYYRYFNPESGVVGAKRLVASGNVSGIDFRDVHGMFNTGSQLYWAKSDGSLNKIGWVNGNAAGAPSGIATKVDNSGWNSRSMFLFQDANGNNKPQ
jgi:hypothetical protein